MKIKLLEKKLFSGIGAAILLFGLFVPASLVLAQAQTVDPNALNTGGNSLYDPFQGKGISDVLQSVVRFLIDLAVPFSVLMCVVAAVFFMTAGGNAQKVKQGMTALTGAVLGLLVVIIAYPILGIVQSQLVGGTFRDVIYSIIGYLQTIGGPLAILMFLWGAFLYTTGSPAKIKVAYQIFIWVSVGVAIIMVATSVEMFIRYFLS